MFGLFSFCPNLSRSGGRQGKVGSRLRDGLRLGFTITAYRKGPRATVIGSATVDYNLLVILERDRLRRMQIACKIVSGW
jgi:hypothetical protein